MPYFDPGDYIIESNKENYPLMRNSEQRQPQFYMPAPPEKKMTMVQVPTLYQMPV